MSIYFQGKKISRLGALTEPSTYDANTPPADVQSGAVYYAQGKRCVGTGKAFEFAKYGSKVIRKITDNNGVQRYGASFGVGENANVVFVAPSKTGDIVLQENYLVTIQEGTEVKIANNHTTGGELKAYYDGVQLMIYLTQYSNNPTILRFFVGKDNHI